MKSQRYVANSVREALDKVKDELGDDAIILSNRRLSSGKVEIIAQISDLQPSELQSSELHANAPDPLKTEGQSAIKAPSVIKATSTDRIAPRAHSNRGGLELTETQTNQLIESFSQGRKTPVSSKQSKTPSKVSLPGVDLSAEINDLKAMLHAHLKENQQPSEKIDTLLIKVQQLLASLGFEAQLVTRWATAITSRVEQNPQVNANHPHQWVKEVFTQLSGVMKHQLKVPDIKLVDQPGIYALLGPTGAGKTTSLAKIAASFVGTRNPKDIGLITTDTERMGASTQMQTLGHALGVDVQSVALNHEVVTALEAFKHKRLVLIDTPGFTFRNTQRHRQLLSLSTLCPQIKTIWVSPATQQASVQNKLYKALAPLSFAGSIITKCDEALSMGESLSLVIRQKIPLNYVCNGQVIPDDLHYFDAKQMLALMGRLYTESMGLDEPQTMVPSIDRRP